MVLRAELLAVHTGGDRTEAESLKQRIDGELVSVHG